MWISFLDGRWIIDDYNESKVLAEITAKGLKPGDPVGELTELLSYATTKDPIIAQGHPDGLGPGGTRSGFGSGGGLGAGGGGGGSGGPMMYKPGGPTTFFGGNGLGPFDGDLSMVKKMAIMRDGVDRTNWMWAAAVKVIEWNEEWTRARKERWGSAVSGGELEREATAQRSTPAPPPIGNGIGVTGTPMPLPSDEEKFRVRPHLRPSTQITRSRPQGPQHPLSVYEPHTGLMHRTYTNFSHVSRLNSSIDLTLPNRSNGYTTDKSTLGSETRSGCRLSRLPSWDECLGNSLCRYCH